MCLLAYYVEWHLRQALAPLLFDYQAIDVARQQRDPVTPAVPSPAAKRKKLIRRTEEGLPIHSFRTLIAELGTRCRHRCRLKVDSETPAIVQETELTPLQALALESIQTFPVTGI